MHPLVAHLGGSQLVQQVMHLVRLRPALCLSPMAHPHLWQHHHMLHRSLGPHSRLQQRIARGESRLVKVADEHMPADFLTKWVDPAKLKRSVAYATNAGAAAH